jgi:hypothetical protein
MLFDVCVNRASNRPSGEVAEEGGIMFPPQASETNNKIASATKGANALVLRFTFIVLILYMAEVLLY